MSHAGAYAANKILAHLPVIEKLRGVGQPNPTHVQMILSDRCDQNCHFCAYRWDGYATNEMFGVNNPDGSRDNNPKRMIPTDKAIEIVDDCSSMGVKAIQFTGGGEPTLHPNHLAIIGHVKQKGIDYALVTNGVRLNRALRALMVDATWMRVSIDAGTHQSYARIRETDPKVYGHVVNNILDMVQLRNKTGSDCYIGVGFVVTAENWHEVLIAAQKAKSWGVDNFRISAVFQPDGAKYFESFYDTAAALCGVAEEFSDDRFTVSNMFGDRIGDLREESPDYRRCGYMNVTTYIGGDLNVYTCCGQSYNQRGLIGSLKNQSFAELWASDEKWEMFDKFDARDCWSCQFNQKNRAINELVDLKPMHPNFV